MAAVALPIVAQVVPLVLPWIAKLMDKVFGNGTGAVKLASGVSIAQTIFAALQKLDPSVGTPQAPAEIQTLLQGVVNALNAKGELQGTATVVDSTAPGILIKGGRDLGIQLLELGVAVIKAN